MTHALSKRQQRSQKKGGALKAAEGALKEAEEGVLKEAVGALKEAVSARLRFQTPVGSRRS